VILTVPAHRWLWSDEDVVAGHHRRYTRRSMRATLARAGFTVRQDSYLFAPLTLPVLLLRSLPHRLLRRPPDQVVAGVPRQHLPPRWVRVAVDALLAPERRWLRAGRSIPIGTTCLVVATADA
jgi:hypothetical protein